MASKIKPAKLHQPQTAEEARTIIEERRPYCDEIFQAIMRGDLFGVAVAQRAMREAFPEG